MDTLCSPRHLSSCRGDKGPSVGLAVFGGLERRFHKTCNVGIATCKIKSTTTKMVKIFSELLKAFELAPTYMEKFSGFFVKVSLQVPEVQTILFFDY